MLVKGNSRIEGLTVFSIILGTVLGGLLISSSVSTALLSHSFIGSLVHTPAEAAILVIAFVYLLAALCNTDDSPHARRAIRPGRRTPFA